MPAVHKTATRRPHLSNPRGPRAAHLRPPSIAGPFLHFLRSAVCLFFFPSVHLRRASTISSLSSSRSHLRRFNPPQPHKPGKRHDLFAPGSPAQLPALLPLGKSHRLSTRSWGNPRRAAIRVSGKRPSSLLPPAPVLLTALPPAPSLTREEGDAPPQGTPRWGAAALRREPLLQRGPRPRCRAHRRGAGPTWLSAPAIATRGATRRSGEGAGTAPRRRLSGRHSWCNRGRLHRPGLTQPESPRSGQWGGRGGRAGPGRAAPGCVAGAAGVEAACEWPQQLKMAEPLPAPVRARSGAEGPASPHPYTPPSLLHGEA